MEGDWSHPIHQPPLKQIQNFDLSGSMEDSDNLEDSKSSSELDVPETETTGDLETNEKTESAILKEGPGDGDKMEPGNSLETGTEKSVTVAENSATGADQSVTVTDQSGTMTEKSATGMEKHVAGAENEDDDDENSLDRTRESEEWKPKPSLSESLPEGRFLFIPPNRLDFVFCVIYFSTGFFINVKPLFKQSLVVQYLGGGGKVKMKENRNFYTLILTSGV